MQWHYNWQTPRKCNAVVMETIYCIKPCMKWMIVHPQYIPSWWWLHCIQAHTTQLCFKINTYFAKQEFIIFHTSSEASFIHCAVGKEAFVAQYKNLHVSYKPKVLGFTMQTQTLKCKNIKIYNTHFCSISL